MKKPTPINSESPFKINELFFSTTDPRGVIQFGNDVFIRVSGYSKEVLTGAPHSIIRHPDMPRAVFKLLWDTIKSGEPIVAYVKNMAANGSYYWVLAFVFPIEGGYISIRLKPSSDLFKAAQHLYISTLEIENESGMEVSVPYLLDQLIKSGFKNYQDFMTQAAFAELSAIQVHEKAESSDNMQTGALAEIQKMSRKTSEDLKNCFQRIQSFQDTNKKFFVTMGELTTGFQNLKYIALNMTVAAAKFGELASSLVVISKEFSDLSTQIQILLQGLTNFVASLSDVVQRCSLFIVALGSQVRMVDFFIKESIQKLENSEDAFSDMVKNKVHFSQLFRKYSAHLQNEIEKLERQLQDVLSRMSEVRKFTTGLEVIRQTGAVESARVEEVNKVFVHYLDEMQKFITLLRNSGKSIEHEMLDLQTNSRFISGSTESLSEIVDQIFELASTYSKNSIQKIN